MEHLGLPYVLGPALGLGLPGIIFVVWYFGSKLQDRTLQAYREDTKKLLEAHRREVSDLHQSFKDTVQAILASYKNDMVEQRRMYDNNVLLVKNFERLAEEQRDVIVANTQAIQRLTDTMKYNRLCPNVKVEDIR